MRLKKADYLITIGLLIISLLMSFFISKLNTNKTGQYIRIEQDSKLLGEYPLNKDREIELKNNNHYNKVIIKDGAAYMQESNCRDQICVHMAKISKDGQTIICLPNRVFVEVVDPDDNKKDESIDKVNR